MVKFIEVKENNRFTGIQAGHSVMFTLREVFINPQHVVCIREDESAMKKLNEGCMPAGLDERQGFTMIHLNRGQSGIDITVVGTPAVVEERLQAQRQLLKG